MHSLDDRRLAELEELYRRDFPRFLRVARAIVGDRELALEAVQDGFGDAIRSRGDFRGEGPLAAWVWRAVVNRARKAGEHERRESSLAYRIDANGQVDEEDARLRAAIALLPDRQRLVLFLRYYADLDYAGIARALGIRVGTVSATLNAAHRALRRALLEVTP
jgi:RNA polymerase sigma-70 factor (ECF subfamily)